MPMYGDIKPVNPYGVSDPTEPRMIDVLVHVGTYVFCGVGGFTIGGHFASSKDRRGLFASSGAVLGLAIANNALNMYRELYMRERNNAPIV